MEEEEVSRLCKSPKIRKLGKCLRLHGFIELQECISRKMLAVSWMEEVQGGLAACQHVFLSARQAGAQAHMLSPRTRVSSVAAPSGSC